MTGIGAQPLHFRAQLIGELSATDGIVAENDMQLRILDVRRRGAIA